MYYLLISGSVNVVLNLVFVIGCHLGVAGVAIATAISNVLSAAMVLTHLYRRDDEFQFRFHRMRIEWKVLKRVLAIGIPAGVQGAIFSVSNVFIQTGINSFGADAIAGSSRWHLNFEYFTYDISAAFGQAAVTFVSQNYGAGNIKRCKKIFWLCMLFGFGFTEILSVIFMIWDNFFVRIYTTSSAVAYYALIRMHRICSLEGLTATYEVESATLRGMGKSVEPSIIIILGTVVFRMIWLVTIFPSDSYICNADGCVCSILDLHRRCDIHYLSASYEENRQECSGIISTIKEKSSGSRDYTSRSFNFCKIDDQIAVIDPHRNLIVESIRMRLVTFFKEITQDRFCLRIYNPIFTYAGILVFHTFLFHNLFFGWTGRQSQCRDQVRRIRLFSQCGHDDR